MLPDIFSAGDVETIVHGFGVAVELVPGTDVESIMDRIGDGLSTMEGVGSVEVEYLGIENSDEDSELAMIDVKDVN